MWRGENSIGCFYKVRYSTAFSKRCVFLLFLGISPIVHFCWMAFLSSYIEMYSVYNSQFIIYFQPSLLVLENNTH